MKYWQKLFYTTFLLFLLVIHGCLFLVVVLMGEQSRQVELRRVQNEAADFQKELKNQTETLLLRSGLDDAVFSSLMESQNDRLKKTGSFAVLNALGEGASAPYGELPFPDEGFDKEAEEGKRVFWFRKKGDVWYLLSREKFRAEGREFSLLYGSRLDAMMENQRQMRKIGMTISAAGSLALALLLYRLLRTLNHPLEELSLAAGQIAEGNYTKRITINHRKPGLRYRPSGGSITENVQRPRQQCRQSGGGTVPENHRKPRLLRRPSGGETVPENARKPLLRYLLFTGRDEITELSESFNEMACAVEQKIDEIQAENRRKQEFIDNMAHEMRTPLTLISGYAETLQYAALSEEERMEDLEKIRSGSRRLELLKEKLLMLTSLKEEALPLEKVNLPELFRNIYEAKEPMLAKKGARWETDLEAVWILGDETLFYSLFENLIHNGIRALKEKGTLEIRSMEKEGRIAVSIRDNGIGMEEKELARIFEPFYRVDKGRSRAEGGAGLGLSLVKRIVEQYEGEITVTSKPQKGTLVTVCFPEKLTIFKTKGGEGL